MKFLTFSDLAFEFALSRKILNVSSGISLIVIAVIVPSLSATYLKSSFLNLFVKDVNDYAKIGDTIYARILEIDENNNHVKLSLKSVVKKRDENKKLNHIKETGSGFIKLEENLDRWIAEKLSEINK